MWRFFSAVKIENFTEKQINIGKAVLMSTHNQMFWIRNKKNCIALYSSVLFYESGV